MNREIFAYLVPDEGLRGYILNGRSRSSEVNPFTTVSNLCACLDNTVNLAFMYVFSCYQDVANRNYAKEGAGPLDELLRGGNANSHRVLSNMKKIYNGYPITAELMQYILLDIYFDYALGEASCLRHIFPNFLNTGCELHPDQVFSVINKTHGSSRSRYDFKLRELRDMLAKLLELFPFLKTNRLCFLEDRGWYAFLPGGSHSLYPEGVINTFGLIGKLCTGAQDDYYYLTDLLFSDMGQKALRYTLVGTDNFVLCPLGGFDGEDNGYGTGVLHAPYVIPRDEEYFCSLLAPDRLESIKQTATDYSIEQLFHIKYKYIKNLALAIADTLGNPSGVDIAKAFRAELEKKFPEAFRRYNAGKSSWDTVVLMLLIETSPSYVLQKLFSPHGEISEHAGALIYRNLHKRFGDEFVENLSKHLSETERSKLRAFPGEALHCYARRLVKIRTANEKVRSFSELQINCIAEKMADVILSSIVFKGDDDPVFFCIGNTKQNLEALEALKHESNAEEKCKGIYKAFGELLIKLICFYEGIFAYGARKMEYDEQAGVRMLSSDKTDKYQRLAEESFSQGAKAKHEQLRGICDGRSLLPILRSFIELCTKCYRLEADKYVRKSESYKLYSVLGKNTVLEEIRQFSDRVDALPELSPETANRWIEEAMAMIRFFRCGSFVGGSDDVSMFSSIIPFIAGYDKGSYNKDGYNTAMFSLVFNTGDPAKRHAEVNVLSEFDYNMNSKYYCLPNVMTSTEKWWIDPFIIKCQAFDEIFEEGK